MKLEAIENLCQDPDFVDAVLRILERKNRIVPQNLAQILDLSHKLSHLLKVKVLYVKGVAQELEIDYAPLLAEMGFFRGISIYEIAIKHQRSSIGWVPSNHYVHRQYTQTS